jgi:WD40-like Beta Propeller Repeat
MSAPAPVAVSEGQEILAGSTEDGNSILFISDRNGKREIFKQARNGGEAERIATNIDEGPGPSEARIRDNMVPRLSPDGRWVLFLARPAATGPLVPTHLMRVPVTGGTPEIVLTNSVIKTNSFRCARKPAELCAIAERIGDELVFTSFDPQRGRGHELLRFPIESTPDAEYAWDLSPDGTHVAIGRRSQAVITVVSLGGGSARRLTGGNWGSLQEIDWAGDGKSLFVSSANKEGASLVRVRVGGGEQRLWDFKGILQASNSPFFGGMTAPRVVESPDGRHLAICSWSVNANMWMLENF